MRIVLVEGAAETRKALAALLTSPGRTIHAFDNLCDAVRAMMREQAHVVVLDLQQMALPCETTLSLVRELNPTLPVILTALEPGGPEVARWLRAGVFRVIPKPVEARELLAAVEQAEALAGIAPAAQKVAARPAPAPNTSPT